MKNTIFSFKNRLFLLFLGSFHLISAQKVDIDKKVVYLNYIKLPYHVIDSNYSKYQVQFNNSTNLSISAEAVSDINLEGYRKVLFDADLIITVNLTGVIITKTEILKNEYKRYNKDKTYSLYYKYFGKIYYATASNYEMHDRAGNILINEHQNSRMEDLYVTKTLEYDSYEAVSNWINNNYTKYMYSFANAEMKSITKILNSKLEIDFALYPTRKNMELYYLGSDKHPEYEEMGRRVEHLNSAINYLRADGSNLESTKQTVIEDIEYLKRIMVKYNRDEKSDKKLRFICGMNLAVIYYSLDLFKEADEICNDLESNDYDKREVKEMVAQIYSAKNRCELHNKPGQHFRLKNL